MLLNLLFVLHSDTSTFPIMSPLLFLHLELSLTSATQNTVVYPVRSPLLLMCCTSEPTASQAREIFSLFLAYSCLGRTQRVRFLRASAGLQKRESGTINVKQASQLSNLMSR